MRLSHRISSVRSKSSKHNNSRFRVADAGLFDSKAEYARYRFLTRAMGRGYISPIIRQKMIPLIDAKLTVAYKPDFIYRVLGTGELICEDLKGAHLVKDALFSLKRKLFEYFYKMPLYVLDSKLEIYDSQCWKQDFDKRKYTLDNRKLRTPHYLKRQNNPDYPESTSMVEEQLKQLNNEIDNLLQAKDEQTN